MGQVLQDSPQPLFCASGCAIDFKITDKRERTVRLDCLLSMQGPWDGVIQIYFLSICLMQGGILTEDAWLVMQFAGAVGILLFGTLVVTSLTRPGHHETWLSSRSNSCRWLLFWAEMNCIKVESRSGVYLLQTILDTWFFFLTIPALLLQVKLLTCQFLNFNYLQCTKFPLGW